MVGGAELGLPLDVDVETMSVELGVLPEARGRGVGDALLSAVREVAAREERQILQAEVFVPTGLAPEEWPGARFAERAGLRCATVEHRFLLDLPVPDVRLDELAAAAEQGASRGRRDRLLGRRLPRGVPRAVGADADADEPGRADRAS